MLLEGLHIPLTTPFHADGRLNLPKLAANVARYSKTPAAGLIVLGLSGEPTLLSGDETREVLRSAAEAASPEKVLLAGISRDSVRTTLALANAAAELAYDAVLVGSPSMLGPMHDRERLTYFFTIADRSPLPIVLFSTGDSDRSFPPQLTAQLATHPNILGLYSDEKHEDKKENTFAPADLKTLLSHLPAIRREVIVTAAFAAVTARMRRAASAISDTPQPALVSAASLARNPASAATAVAAPPSTTTLKTRTKAVGFQILAASHRHMLPALRSGASAIAPTFAACAPQACYEVYAAWKDDDQPLAGEKQARLQEAAHLAEQIGPGGLKFGCDLNGYFGGLPRLPHLPPTGEQRAALEHLMEGLRN